MRYEESPAPPCGPSWRFHSWRSFGWFSGQDLGSFVYTA